MIGISERIITQEPQKAGRNQVTIAKNPLLLTKGTDIGLASHSDLSLV